MTEIVWHGRGGQGAFTAARILGIAATVFADKFALSFPTFGPERRGAPVFGFTKIDDSHISDRSEIEIADYHIYLDDSLYCDKSLKNLKKDGLLLVNTPHLDRTKFGAHAAGIDATVLAAKIIGKSIVNTAMLGALAAVWNGVSMNSLRQAITSEMKPGLAEKNIALLDEAYNKTRKEPA